MKQRQINKPDVMIFLRKQSMDDGNASEEDE